MYAASKCSPKELTFVVPEPVPLDIKDYIMYGSQILFILKRVQMVNISKLITF